MILCRADIVESGILLELLGIDRRCPRTYHTVATVFPTCLIGLCVSLKVTSRSLMAKCAKYCSKEVLCSCPMFWYEQFVSSMALGDRWCTTEVLQKQSRELVSNVFLNIFNGSMSQEAAPSSGFVTIHTIGKYKNSFTDTQIDSSPSLLRITAFSFRTLRAVVLGIYHGLMLDSRTELPPGYFDFESNIR